MSRKKTADKAADADLLNAGAAAPEAGAPAQNTPPADPAAQPPAGADVQPAAPGGVEDQKEAPEGQSAPAPATGVAVAFLLKGGPLGGKGEVVRVSHAKLASLGLESGKHWRPATPAERETAGK